MDKPNTSLKRPTLKPTIKQKRAVANLVANGGSVSQAMRDAGYSEAMARNPQKLTESEYVQAMMAEVGLADVDGFKLLKEGMNSTKSVPMGKSEPDYQTRHKYLETFFKVRGVGRQVEGTPISVHFHNHQEKETGEYGL